MSSSNGNYYNRGFKDHHVGAVLKYTQSAKVTSRDWFQTLKCISRRNQGLAGRINYNWKYRYFVT